ncbi:MAG: hypothetical protein N2Z67_04695 [Acetobacteraceae bacterium]|nr:hypothetical protein [Acetobacteraceae bacterium]
MLALLLASAPAAADPAPSPAFAAFAELCLGALAARAPVAELLARRHGPAAIPDAAPAAPPGIRILGAWRLPGEPPLRLVLAEPGGQCIVFGPPAPAEAVLAEAEALFGRSASLLPGFLRLSGPERAAPGGSPPQRLLWRARLIEAEAPPGRGQRVVALLVSAGGGGPVVVSAEAEEALPLRR